MTLVFSTTKGMSAMTMALAHSRGWLDYEERVAAYWPEFAQAGKERTTVRHLLSPGGALRLRRSGPGSIADLDRLAGIMERQRPAWEPGERQAYHAISLGFYEGDSSAGWTRSTAPSASSSATRSRPARAGVLHPPAGVDARLAPRATHPAQPAADAGRPAIGRSCSTLSTPGRCSTARSSRIPGRWCPSIATESMPGSWRSLRRRRGHGPSHRPGLRRLRQRTAGSWGCGPRRSRRCRRPQSRRRRGFYDACFKGEVQFSLGFMKPTPIWPSVVPRHSEPRARAARSGMRNRRRALATGTSRTASAPSRTATPATWWQDGPTTVSSEVPVLH